MSIPLSSVFRGDLGTSELVLTGSVFLPVCTWLNEEGGRLGSWEPVVMVGLPLLCTAADDGERIVPGTGAVAFRPR
jgi:hypothetical protein